MAWDGHKRELPTNWAAIRDAVMIRDGRICRWLTNGKRCTHTATDVDHIKRNDDHSLGNLRALCAWHHRRKSSHEGNAARKRVTTKRPQEAHPGLVG